MTKICIASSGLGHVVRGIEAWANDLGQALAVRGEDVLLCKGAGTAEADFERVIPCWTREAAKTQKLLKWIPQSLAWRVGLSSGYGVEQLTFARNLINVLKREKVDVLHVQDPFVALAVQKAHHRGRLRTRTILAHGTEESFEFLNRLVYVQHLAPWHQCEARAAGFDRETWTSLPNFIDTDHFQPGCRQTIKEELGIPTDALVVLSAAAIKRHHKRVDYLVSEFGLIRERHPGLPAWLVVAGGWESQTQEVMDEATKLLGDRVRFLPRFPRERMPELYRAADLFTLGSLKEMMPIALLEASASELPCVVNQHPVMQWMIGPGGEAIDLSQSGSWADCVANLLRDSRKRTELGRQARLHCLENFGRHRVVDRICDYYQFVHTHDPLSFTNSAEAAA